MKKSILITGLAGTGKSTLSKELNKLWYKSLSIEDISDMFIIVDKKTWHKINHYENNLEAVHWTDRICDIEKLQKLIDENQSQVTFYTGTASNIDNLLPLFDKVLLLKTNEEILRQRLSNRTPEDFAYTIDVQNRMFGWKDERETHMIEKWAIPINANNWLWETIETILKTVKD